MLSINKVILAGNLTRDPETRQTQGGLTICEFGIAVTRKIKDKDETCFVNITVFGKAAETSSKYLAKGSNVYVEGRLQLDQWEDRNSGAKRSALKVVADQVQFLSGNKGGGEARDGSSRRAERGTPRQVPDEYAPPMGNGSQGGNTEELPPF